MGKYNYSVAKSLRYTLLNSFYFITFKATSTNVFRSNDAVVYNSYFLNVCIVRTRCLTITVAYLIAG